MNYFDFFELPISFTIDEAALKRRFYQNSKKYHPDFHTLADEAQQTEMLELSTLNNEAFKTLSDPDRRMKYVLELRGAFAPEGENKLPNEFLAEMMDINESLMELEFDFDPKRLEQTRLSVERLENQLLADIQPLLDSWQDSPEQLPDLSRVKDYFLKRRYLLRILENLSKFAPAFQ